MIKQSGCFENCFYCVSVRYKAESDHNHIECIGLYTELIGWHCLGADSKLILEVAM